MPGTEPHNKTERKAGIKRCFSAIHLNNLQVHTNQGKAFLALAALSLLWGTTWIASKEGVRHMPALELVAVRQLIAGTCYLLFFIIKGAALPRWKEMGPLLILAFLNFICSNGLSTWGVKYISAGLGSIIGAIFPLWLVVIGLFSSKQKTPRKAIRGFLLGFVGVCIIFYDHLIDFLNPDFRFGILISLIATWTWALGSLYTKKQVAQFNPYFGIGFQMFISGAVLLGFTASSDSFLPIQNIPFQSWMAILYLVLLGSIAAFACFLYAIQHLSTEQVSIYAYINPVVAVLVGSLFFQEQLSPVLLTGGAVTLYGVYIVNKAYRKK